MEIRAYEEQDQRALVQLWQDCGLTVPWNDPQRDIIRKLAVGRELFLVAREGEELVASVMGGYDGHRGWINYLAVAPERQGQGLGRQMMAAVEARLEAIGCAKINLQIRAGNSSVIAFYAALGYQQDPVVSFGKRLQSDQ